MSKHVYTLAGASLLIWPGALAQSGSPIETEMDIDAVAVILPLSNNDTARDAEPVLSELSLTASTQKVLDNGVRLRARGALRLQRDHPNRPGGLDGIGSDRSAPVGALTGQSSALTIDDDAMRGRLETAYLQIDGGYGEARLGKDQGVAARFYEGPRSVLSHARLDSALLDPSGLTSVRTRHDLTGQSAKLSYATPRLLGLRGGVSITPEANADGLDRRPAAGTGGISPETEQAIELAVNGTRRLPDSDVRIDFTLAWSQADITRKGLTAPYGRINSVSAGTRIEKADWTVGLAWLGTDNGLPDRDYEAWSAGLHRTAYDTDFSIEYGQSEDQGLGLEGSSWRVGAARHLGTSARLAIAYLHDERDSLAEHLKTQGIVVEITLSQEILNLTGN